MGGTLDPDDTPGGGLTMIITLPAYTPDLADPMLTSRADSVRQRGHRR
jgi:two-component system sensor histidine kinase KdpD